MPKKNKMLNITIAVILGIVGLAYLFLPHATHIALGIDFGLEHMVHNIIGVVLLIGATGILIFKK